MDPVTSVQPMAWKTRDELHTLVNRLLRFQDSDHGFPSRLPKESTISIGSLSHLEERGLIRLGSANYPNRYNPLETPKAFVHDSVIPSLSDLCDALAIACEQDARLAERLSSNNKYSRIVLRMYRCTILRCDCSSSSFAFSFYACNCIFKNEIALWKSQITGDVLLDNCRLETDLVLTGGAIEGSLTIRDCRIAGHAWATGCSFQGDVEVEDSFLNSIELCEAVFLSKLLLINVSCSTFHMHHAKLDGYFGISNLLCAGRALFAQAQFSDQVHIKKIAGPAIFDCEGAIFRSLVHVESTSGAIRLHVPRSHFHSQLDIECVSHSKVFLDFNKTVFHDSASVHMPIELVADPPKSHLYLDGQVISFGSCLLVWATWLGEYLSVICEGLGLRSIADKYNLGLSHSLFIGENGIDETRLRTASDCYLTLKSAVSRHGWNPKLEDLCHYRALRTRARARLVRRAHSPSTIAFALFEYTVLDICLGYLLKPSRILVTCIAVVFLCAAAIYSTLAAPHRLSFAGALAESARSFLALGVPGTNLDSIPDTVALIASASGTLLLPLFIVSLGRKIIR